MASLEEHLRHHDLARDPILFWKLCWPHIQFYREQIEVIESVRDNIETFVPAGNMLGKDFVAGFIIVWFFCTRYPCRIVTTSAKDDHLRVLWGEINTFINSSRVALREDQGGQLVVTHHSIRRLLRSKGELSEKCYVKGMVASPDSIASMQGHHIANTGDGIPRTLFVPDECSSVPDEYKRMAVSWYNRMLAIGNTWECENFWKHAIEGKPGTDDEGGDLPHPSGKSFYRKVIHIDAEKSPNVRFALAQQAAGIEPTGEVIVPGVKSWEEYQRNLATWDEVQQTVSLRALFYKGKGVKLFPKEWLEHSMMLARRFPPGTKRIAKGIGIDPAEGGDNTAMAAVDEHGLIELVSKKTPDTSVIVSEAIAFMKYHNVPPEATCFDRGGGGKQHADALRAKGFAVRTVAFGEPVLLDLKRGLTLMKERSENREERYTYKNRRAELFGELSIACDPAAGPGFLIHPKYAELLRQLRAIPKQYDGEGRLELPPKNKKPGADSKVITLMDLLGCSPDEADAVVLARHGATHKVHRAVAGGF